MACWHGRSGFRLPGSAGQYQQSPTPRKGGIFKREYWQPYVPTKDNKWPEFDFIVVSVDSAFTGREEDDPTGCTTWGVWTDPADGYPPGHADLGVAEAPPEASGP
jgi:hypothetical protein